MRVTDLIEAHADELWELVGDDSDGVVYICGKAGFAHTVVEGLRGIAAAHGDGDSFVRRLLGTRRLRMDVFTTTAPLRAPGPLGGRTVPASDLVTRNDDNAGYWMAIDGAVYDVSEFRHLHPGGSQILLESAGTDASKEYRAVLHDLNPEVGAMLSMYKVGLVQRLRLGSGWGIRATVGRLVDVSVADLYRAWVRYTYLVVEMQNASRNDWTYAALPLTRGEVEPLTTQKLMFMANTHERFVVQYLDGSVGDDLARLWRMTTALGGPGAPIDELPAAITAVQSGAEAITAAGIATELQRLYVTSRSREAAADDRFWLAAGELWRDVHAVHNAYLAQLKATLREGLFLFETHEHEAVDQGGAELVELLRAVPLLVQGAYEGLARAWDRAAVREWCP